MRFRDIVIYALVGALTLPAQQAAPVQATPLTVNVIAGEGQQNSIRKRTAVAPVIEVKDADGKPVVGAEVVFQLPLAGPGGMFNGWLRTQTVRSDAQGKATVQGYAPNTEEGRFTIKVTVTSGSQSGSAVISQTNGEPGKDELMPGTAVPAVAQKNKKSIPWKIVGPAAVVAVIVVVAVILRND